MLPTRARWTLLAPFALALLFLTPAGVAIAPSQPTVSAERRVDASLVEAGGEVLVTVAVSTTGGPFGVALVERAPPGWSFEVIDRAGAFAQSGSLEFLWLETPAAGATVRYRLHAPSSLSPGSVALAGTVRYAGATATSVGGTSELQVVAAGFTASRAIENATIPPGGTTRVTMTATSAGRAFGLALHETVPAGWSATLVATDGALARAATLEWLWLEHAGGSRAVSYLLTAPSDAAEGTVTLSGLLRDASGRRAPVAGDVEVRIARPVAPPPPVAGPAPAPEAPPPPENRAPSLAVLVTPTEPEDGDVVRFDASATRDPDGDAVAFAWTIDGAPASGSVVELPLAAGERPWMLVATDARGLVATTTGRVVVSGVPALGVAVARRVEEGANVSATVTVDGAPAERAVVTFGAARAVTDERGVATLVAPRVAVDALVNLVATRERALPATVAVLVADARRPLALAAPSEVNEGDSFSVRATSGGDAMPGAMVRLLDRVALTGPDGEATFVAPLLPGDYAGSIVAEKAGYEPGHAPIRILSIARALTLAPASIEAAEGQAFEVRVRGDFGPVPGARLAWGGSIVETDPLGAARLVAPRVDTEAVVPLVASAEGYLEARADVRVLDVQKEIPVAIVLTDSAPEIAESRVSAHLDLAGDAGGELVLADPSLSVRASRAEISRDVSVVVASDENRPRTFALSLAAEDAPGDALVHVTMDGADLVLVADVGALESSGVGAYLVERTAERVIVLVRIPHFSVHVLDVSTSPPAARARVFVDAEAPEIVSVIATPALAGPGALVRVEARVRDASPLAAVAANGVALAWDADLAAWIGAIEAPRGDGPVDVRVVASDAAGNSAEAREALLTVDATAPSVAWTSPVEDLVLSGVVDLTGAVADATGAQAEILLDGRPLARSASLAWDSSLVPDGPHVLALKAVDAVGNVAEERLAVVVDNDRVALSAVAEAPVFAAPGAVARVAVRVADAAPGALRVTLERDGRTFGEATTLPRAGTSVAVVEISLPADAPEGILDARAAIEDRQGGAALALPAAVTVDATPPRVEPSGPAPRVRPGQAVSVALAVFDASPVSLEGAALAARSADGRLEAVVVAPRTEGEAQAPIRVVDAAGHATMALVPLVVDGTPPRIGDPELPPLAPGAILLPLAGERPFVASGPVIIDATIDADDLAFLAIEADGAVIATALPATWTPPRGPDALHEIRIVARDAAGNEASVARGVFTDVAPPLIEVVEAPAAAKPGASVELAVRYHGSPSSLAATLHVDGVAVATARVDEPAPGSPAIATLSLAAPESLAEGTAEVRVRVEEASGGAAESAVPLRVDATPPSIEILEVEPRVAKPGDLVAVRVRSADAVHVSASDVPLAGSAGVWEGRARAASSGIEVEARDSAGNAAFAQVPVELDGEPPVVAIAAPNTPLSPLARIPIAAEGAARVVVTIDGRPLARDADGAVTLDATLADGPHALEAIAVDAAGNVARALANVIVDGEPPRVAWTGAGEILARPGGDVTAKLAVEDATRVALRLAWWDASSRPLGEVDLADAELRAGRLRAPSPLAEGSYVVVVRATDALGRETLLPPRDVRVEPALEPLVADFAADPAVARGGQEAAIAIRFQRDAHVARVEVEGRALARVGDRWVGAWHAPDASGLARVDARVVDLAGDAWNVAVGLVPVDADPPALSWAPDDVVTGVVTIDPSLDPNDAVIVTVAVDGAVLATRVPAEWDSRLAPDFSRHEVTITVRDASGNSRSLTRELVTWNGAPAIALAEGATRGVKPGGELRVPLLHTSARDSLARVALASDTRVLASTLVRLPAGEAALVDAVLAVPSSASGEYALVVTLAEGASKDQPARPRRTRIKPARPVRSPPEARRAQRGGPRRPRSSRRILR